MKTCWAGPWTSRFWPGPPILRGRLRLTRLAGQPLAGPDLLVQARWAWLTGQCLPLPQPLKLSYPWVKFFLTSREMDISAVPMPRCWLSTMKLCNFGWNTGQGSLLQVIRSTYLCIPMFSSTSRGSEAFLCCWRRTARYLLFTCELFEIGTSSPTGFSTSATKCQL